MIDNKIAFFQIDNLIRGRIPFFFVTIDCELKSWYGPLEKIHLNTWTIEAQPDNVMSLIAERQAPKDFGIVVICKDGISSLEVYNNLISEGYSNAYWVEGGLETLKKEKAE